MAKKKKSTKGKQLTESQKAWLDAWRKAPVDRAALEAECRELIRLKKQGKLLSFEKVLEDLGVIRRKKTKKPA